jgi:hypothetical protein
VVAISGRDLSVVAVLTVIVTAGLACGQGRDSSEPARTSATPQPVPTTAAPRAPTAQPVAPAPRASRTAEPAKTLETAGADGDRARARRIRRRVARSPARRGYTPRKGEAVVPNRSECSGPDVFDQPGCETIAER